MKKLEKNRNNEKYLKNKLISIEEIFKEKEAISIHDKRFNYFLNGGKITINKPNNIYRIYNNKRFVGLGIVSNEKLKRDVII